MGNFFDISQEIWERKYRYQGNGSGKGDKSFEDTWARVAAAAAANEDNPARRRDEFMEILAGHRFLPGGRILANAGTGRAQTTMFNCYVMGTIDDSIEGIFDTVKESALTQKQGGGVGFDFSTLRPQGSPIKGCEAESSGPLSFMRVLDSTCRTIMSAGQRRGAQMGVMRCDHPDIERFVTAKRGNAELRMFNLSVAITDKFIEAVREGGKWDLIFKGEVHKTIEAAALWQLIMDSTYEHAEPGFILIDRINQMNNLNYCETIAACNPCGEQPLPPYGACLLGSLNLTQFVKSPFSKNAAVDFDGIRHTTRTATRLLDNIIDLSNYPLEAQRREANSKRRMGIGITGLADMFIFLGLRYGAEPSVKLAGEIMESISIAAYEASVELGREKGVFPVFDAAKYAVGGFAATLPRELRDAIKKHGLRNSHLTSIAPTGTISLLAGNISSGLEPVFAMKYKRRILQNGNQAEAVEVDVADYAYQRYFSGKRRDETDELPECFVTTDDVTPEQHLDMQAALQRHVDSSISKTINVPGDFPFESFEDIYMRAFDKGLKGCTTFRPTGNLAGVLIREDVGKAKTDETDKGAVVDIAPLHIHKRPGELEGSTYKIRSPLSSEALYVTINDIVDDWGNRRPYELFINTKNLQHLSWIVAMTRLISAIFRRDPNPSFLVEELENIFDPGGGYFRNGKYIPSLVADIGKIIEIHLNKIGIMKSLDAEAETVGMGVGGGESKPAGHAGLMFCPQCNAMALTSQENCLKCLSCGFSKCG